MTDEDVNRALGQRQRLDLLGEIVGGLSHELNNALSVAAGQAELLAERLGGAPADGKAAAEAGKVADWTHRAASVSGRLVELSRTLRQGRGRVDLRRLAGGAAQGLRYRCEGDGLVLAVETAAAPLFVDGAPGPLQQAIVNLIQNSREALVASGEGGTIRVAARQDGQRGRVEVEDDGPGLAAHLGERVFDPFCTTREERPGAGLGLTVARWIARDHGGDLRLDAAAAGALAILELPLAHD